MSTIQRWAKGKFVNSKKPQKREVKKVHVKKRKHLRRNDRLYRLLFN